MSSGLPLLPVNPRVTDEANSCLFTYLLTYLLTVHIITCLNYNREISTPLMRKF